MRSIGGSCITRSRMIPASRPTASKSKAPTKRLSSFDPSTDSGGRAGRTAQPCPRRFVSHSRQSARWDSARSLSALSQRSKRLNVGRSVLVFNLGNKPGVNDVKGTVTVNDDKRVANARRHEYVVQVRHLQHPAIGQMDFERAKRTGLNKATNVFDLHVP